MNSNMNYVRVKKQYPAKECYKFREVNVFISTMHSVKGIALSPQKHCHCNSFCLLEGGTT